MFGLKPKLPVSDEERIWVNEGFARLTKMLGQRRMLDAPMILPTPEFFPDSYDESDAGAEQILRRICFYMKVDRNQLEFEVMPDEIGELQTHLPSWRGSHNGAAGMYIAPENKSADSKSSEADLETSGKSMIVCVHASKLKNPTALVATIAHELGHVILLGGRLMDRNVPDMEPMTDLLTVFLGFGLFSANSAFQFSQFQTDQRQGWSTSRLGYLSEEIYGYALAEFARQRKEENPAWAKLLSTNVLSYYKRSASWLRQQREMGPYHPKPI